MNDIQVAVDVERALYQDYVHEKSGDNPGGRVYPTRVKKAQLAWYGALTERAAIIDRIARKEGRRSSSVLRAWYAESTLRKGVKRQK